MVFSSFVFLLVFLPAFLALYWLCPPRLRNGCALAASALFYAWGAPAFAPILLASCVTDYLLGRAIERTPASLARRRRRLLAAAVGANLAFFLYFKYSNFLVAEASRLLEALGAGRVPWVEVALPIGISFITFHKISYLVDVYRGAVHAARGFGHYLLYILLFPQLIAGPILRYHLMAHQIASRRVDAARVVDGIARFCQGLAKKVLVANVLGEVADRAFSAPLDQLPGLHAWVGVLCYSFQIYFDFSGYSDMAIGLGRMMGFEFIENFHHPYIARNFSEFWRRWHISLSSWMREYLYLPLGGNRVRPVRVYLNLWTVFLLSGLWHGASWNFVAWGAFHGLFLSLDKALAATRLGRPPRWLGIPLTFLLVLVGWVFFRARDLAHALGYLGRMAALDGIREAATPRALSGFIAPHAWAVLVLAGALSFAPAVRAWLDDDWAPRATLPPPRPGLARYGAALGLAALSAASLATGAFNPFIYFRF